MVCWGDVQGKYGASGRMIRLRLTLTGRCTAALSSLDFAIVIAYQVTLSLLMSLRDMVHPGGFEPPTARFVAEYSIQLSYGCIGIYCFTAGSTSSLLMSLRNMVHPGGFEPPTARFVAEYSIQLSYGCIGDTALLLIQRHANCNQAEEDGASGRIRTSDRSVRSRVLYPAELRMHRDLLLYC